MHQLIDVMLRHKFLQLLADEKEQKLGETKMDWDSVSKTEYHLCKACEALNLPVGDVPKLVRDMELLIVAARKGAVAGNVKTQGVKDRVRDLFYLKPNNRALELLLDNLLMLEKNYKEQLGYEITEECAEGLVAMHGREQFLESALLIVRNIAVMTGCFGAALVAYRGT